MNIRAELHKINSRRFAWAREITRVRTNEETGLLERTPGYAISWGPGRETRVAYYTTAQGEIDAWNECRAWLDKVSGSYKRLH